MHAHVYFDYADPFQGVTDGLWEWVGKEGYIEMVRIKKGERSNKKKLQRVKFRSSIFCHTHAFAKFHSYTGCSLIILCFSLKCCDFFELCKFCCSACVLPAILYTHWHRGETERGKSPEYILKSSKKTQYSMNTLYYRRFRWGTSMYLITYSQPLFS